MNDKKNPKIPILRAGTIRTTNDSNKKEEKPNKLGRASKSKL